MEFDTTEEMLEGELDIVYTFIRLLESLGIASYLEFNHKGYDFCLRRRYEQ